MKTQLVAAALAAPLIAAAAPAIAAADPAPVMPTGIVTDVVDGDTVHVLDAARGDITVRVLGVDTPETKKPGYTVGCWGPQASDYARSALLGQPISVVSDPTQDTVDKYGRTLAYLVRPDGFNYSIEAARVGAAKPYVYGNNPVARAGDIAAAAEQARTTGTGLWGAPCNGNTDSVPLAPAPEPTPAPAPTPEATPDLPLQRSGPDTDCPDYTTPVRVLPGDPHRLDADGDGIGCDAN